MSYKKKKKETNNLLFSRFFSCNYPMDLDLLFRLSFNRDVTLLLNFLIRIFKKLEISIIVVFVLETWHDRIVLYKDDATMKVRREMSRNARDIFFSRHLKPLTRISRHFTVKHSRRLAFVPVRDDSMTLPLHVETNTSNFTKLNFSTVPLNQNEEDDILPMSRVPLKNIVSALTRTKPL